MAALFVDVWQGDILSEQAEVQDYLQYLSAEEKQKIAEFSHKEAQQKYINTRAKLRKVLAEYLNQSPQKIAIKLGEYGKPYVEDEMFFNISHSRNKMVVVVSNGGEVGVDIEQYKPRKNLAGLMKKCFSVKEQEYWLALSEAEQVTQFFRLWVRKEAFVKAIGRGIALGLNQCEVNPQDFTSFLTVPLQCGKAVDWRIVDIQFSKKYTGALVVKNKQYNYRQLKLI